jgi:hypothetical protein
MLSLRKKIHENKIGWGFLIYLPIPLAMISAASLLQWVDGARVDRLYYASIIIIFLIGVGHVIVIKDYIEGITAHSLAWGLGITGLIVVISGLISFVVYRLAGLNGEFLTCIVAFAIPLTCWYVFRMLKNMEGDHNTDMPGSSDQQ